MDRLVTEVGKLREQQGGEKVMQNLVKQLRDLIAQWDWAQARHRHVAKIVGRKAWAGDNMNKFVILSILKSSRKI